MWGIKNMKRSKRMKLGALLAAMLLLSMAFVPAVSAQVVSVSAQAKNVTSIANEFLGDLNDTKK